MLPNSARVAHGAIALGLVAGAIYYVALMYAHQSNRNDAELLLVFGLLFWLPISLVVLCPAWLLIPRIVNARSKQNRWLLALAAIALPTAVVIAGVIDQGSDWDELLLYVIVFLPTTLAVLGMTLSLGSPTAISPPRG
jgi:uncharacterized membrane protein YdjX (TVP38/TMEM64 family)